MTEMPLKGQNMFQPRKVILRKNVENSRLHNSSVHGQLTKKKLHEDMHIHNFIIWIFRYFLIKTKNTFPYHGMLHHCQSVLRPGPSSLSLVYVSPGNYFDSDSYIIWFCTFQIRRSYCLYPRIHHWPTSLILQHSYSTCCWGCQV